MSFIQDAIVLVLYNPKSTGQSQRNATRFAKKLNKLTGEKQVILTPTNHPGHAEELTYKTALKSKSLFVVSSSGDGGYNEVVNGALRAQAEGATVVTGLLPSGNANDHYKALHKPYVIKRIKAGNIRQVDVLKISSTINGKPWERYAHSYIGFGMSSEIGKALNEADLNPANELLIAAKAFVKFQAFTAKVDGKKQSFQSILMSNVGRMSKVLSLSKKAKVDDGLFEFVTAEDNKAKLIATLAKSATIGVPHEEQRKSYTFETVEALPVQLDGEVFELDANSKVRIVIARHALACVI